MSHHRNSSGAAALARSLTDGADAVEGARDAHVEFLGRLRLGQLDGVLKSFLTTHKQNDHTYTLSELLHNPPLLPFKLRFYDADGKCWLATVESGKLDDNTVLYIRLPNNGYDYEACAGEMVAHHDRDDFVIIPKAHGAFPTITASMAGCPGDVYYSCTGLRCDIDVFAQKPKMADLCLSFEHGYEYRHGQQRTSFF